MVTFLHRRSTPTGATPRTKEVILIEERAQLHPSASEVEKATEEQRIVDCVLKRVETLCEKKKLIPDGAKEAIKLGVGADQDRFIFLDAEPADFRSHKILDPTETHFGLPNENLRKKWVPPKIIQVFGH